MRVLVTGGSGYIGTTLIPHLVAQGHRVWSLDLMTGDTSAEIACSVHGDVRDGALLRHLVAQVDAVVHLAAIVGTPACDADPQAAVSINVDGTAALVAAVPRGMPLILASTCSVYGRATAPICREHDPVAPLTLYSVTKAEAERIVLSAGGIVLRFVTAYGLSPRFRWDLMLHTFLRVALDGERLRLFDPDAWRPMLHVHDAARAIGFALERVALMSGRVFNVGSASATLTKRGLAERVRRIAGLHFEIDAHGSDPDQRDYRVSFERIDALGFAAQTDIDEAIAATLEGARHLLARAA